MTAVRSYIAGMGASGALIGAAVLAFVVLLALVSFEGFPIAGGSDDTDAVSVDAGGGRIGAVTAAAVGAAPGAVAATPTAPIPGAGAAAGTGAGAGGGPGAAAAGDAGAGGDTGTAAPGTSPTAPPGTTPSTPTAPTTPPAPASSPNPVNEAASGVDTAVENTTGVNPDLGGTTKPVTDAVDGVLEDTTGNDLGGHVDNVTGALP